MPVLAPRTAVSHTYQYREEVLALIGFSLYPTPINSADSRLPTSAHFPSFFGISIPLGEFLHVYSRCPAAVAPTSLLRANRAACRFCRSSPLGLTPVHAPFRSPLRTLSRQAPRKDNARRRWVQAFYEHFCSLHRGSWKRNTYFSGTGPLARALSLESWGQPTPLRLESTPFLHVFGLATVSNRPCGGSEGGVLPCLCLPHGPRTALRAAAALEPALRTLSYTSPTHADFAMSCF